MINQESPDKYNDMESRLSHNVERIRDTITEDVLPDSSIQEMKRKFIEIMNENDDLKD